MNISSQNNPQGSDHARQESEPAAQSPNPPQIDTSSPSIQLESFDWVVKDKTTGMNVIGIGSFAASVQGELLQHYGIKSILRLSVRPQLLNLPHFAPEPHPPYHESLFGGGLDDRLDELRRAVEKLEELVKTAPPVLVHCGAGIERGPTVVAAYLMKVYGMNYSEAVQAVQEKRARASIPDSYKTLLDQFGDDLFPSESFTSKFGNLIRKRLSFFQEGIKRDCIFHN